MRMTYSAYSALLFGGVIAACSSTPAQPDADAGAKDVSQPKDVIVADQAPPPSCEDVKACDMTSPPAMQSCVVTIDATLVDLTAKPVAGQSVFICGLNLCTSPLLSDAAGKVHSAICLWFFKPAFKFLGGPNYVSFASGIPDATSAVSLPSVNLVPLPLVGVDFPNAGGDLVSNGVTLTVAASSFMFDASESSDPNWHKFRAAQVPLDKAPPYFDTTLKLEVLWGLAPVNTLLTPSAGLKVPNTKNWAANAAVELFLNGANNGASKPPAPYGGWAAIGTGHVSADGMTVSSDPGAGNGIPMIGIVGIRLK